MLFKEIGWSLTSIALLTKEPHIQRNRKKMAVTFKIFFILI